MLIHAPICFLAPRRVEGLQSKRRTIQENFDKLNRTLERRLQIAENNLSQSEDNLKEVDRAQKSGVIHLMNLRIPIDLTEDPAAAAISNAQKINS